MNIQFSAAFILKQSINNPVQKMLIFFLNFAIMYYSEGYTVRIAELKVTPSVVNRSHLGCYGPAELG